MFANYLPFPFQTSRLMPHATGRKRTTPQGPVFPRERCWAGNRWTQSRLAVVRGRGKVLCGKAHSRMEERGLAMVPPIEASEWRLC